MNIGATIFLAKLIGVFCLIMGSSMIKRNMMMDVFRELSRQRALSYVMGVLMLIMGLLVTLTHTKWENSLTTLITLIGWGIFFEAMVFLFSAKEAVARYVNALENKLVYYFIALGYLLIGAYLFYNGFL